MKKKILALTLFLSVFVSGVALGSSQWGQYQGHEIVKVLVNGKTVTSEVPAYIDGQGTTMLPLRAIAEALGAAVAWDGSTYTVKVDTPLSQEALNTVAKSVAQINILNESGQTVKRGSGFVINSSILVTNQHVGGGAKGVQVNLNGKIYTNPPVMFENATTDVMGFKLPESVGGLKYSTVLPGKLDKVFSIGYPHGTLEIGSGIVTDIWENQGVTYISNTAPSEHGGSGGVIIDNSGQVIGVDTAGYDGTQLALATPMSYVEQELTNQHLP